MDSVFYVRLDFGSGDFCDPGGRTFSRISELGGGEFLRIKNFLFFGYTDIKQVKE